MPRDSRLYIVSFTGSRGGMSAEQKRTVRDILLGRFAKYGFYVIGQHGDCIGSDADFNAICRSLRLTTWSRPCNLEAQRAFTDAKQVADPKPPLERNDDIARTCHELIAAPSGHREVVRSGTWATIRRARKYGKFLSVVPNRAPWWSEGRKPK